jgi:hypothetical protein
MTNIEHPPLSMFVVHTALLGLGYLVSGHRGSPDLSMNMVGIELLWQGNLSGRFRH